MYAILFSVLGFFILGEGSVEASESWRNNTSALPQYCKDRAKGSQSPEFGKWRRTFGEAFIHMHHYCSGIYAENKARASSDKRHKWLGVVAHQMGYVSNHCKKGCVLYPELHSRWGWALGEQRKFTDAIKHYQLAFQVKRNYTSAYAGLSDLYVKLKQPDEARKVLEAGLKVRPGSRKLERRLQKLKKTK